MRGRVGNRFRTSARTAVVLLAALALIALVAALGRASSARTHAWQPSHAS